jgi:hypothetical protein
MEKETLEEAAKNESEYLTDYDDKEMYKKGFIEGAKWQQEQDKKFYSEEEVLDQLNLLYAMKNSLVDTFTDEEDYITMKWFEQFKNK